MKQKLVNGILGFVGVIIGGFFMSVYKDIVSIPAIRKQLNGFVKNR